MIRRILKKTRRFKKDEEGNASLEFAMVFPALMFLTMSGVEVAFVTIHHVMLEQAVDLTVRDIRLGTGTDFEHDTIKTTICERATYISGCNENLRLEMIPLDPRVGVAIPTDPDCTDNTEEVKPVREFVNGQANELMVLRACAKINPIFPASGMGKKLGDNAEGQYALTATTVFVQEP